MDVEFALGVYDKRYDSEGEDYNPPSDSDSEPEEDYYSSDVDGWHESYVSDEDHDDAGEQSEDEDSN
jgi:hypothetical protein